MRDFFVLHHHLLGQGFLVSQALSLFSAREDPPVLFFFPPFVYVFILKFFHTRAVCAATYAIMANSVSYYAFIWLFVFQGILSQCQTCFGPQIP